MTSDTYPPKKALTQEPKPTNLYPLMNDKLQITPELKELGNKLEAKAKKIGIDFSAGSRLSPEDRRAQVQKVYRVPREQLLGKR
jgi:hypothetical protein